MSSEYFDSDDHQQVAATRARASAVNNALDAIDTGLALLPTEADIKGGLINYAVDSGAADVYVVTLTYVPAAYTDGMQVVFKASASNTGACTINVNALGAKSITRQDGTTPVAGDIGTDKIVELRYNSTAGKFEMQGSIGAAAGSGTMASQNANAVDIVGGNIQGVDLSVGFYLRSKFAFVDVTSITVGGGTYDVNGTLAKITSELTTTAHGVTGNDIAYLYIDYSSISASGVLIQSDLVWSTTVPTWSHTLLGLYNGNDRCIFGGYVAGNNLWEFYHDNDSIIYVPKMSIQSATDYDTTWTDCTAFLMPAYARRVMGYFELDAMADATGVFATWRPNGTSHTDGHVLAEVDEDSDRAELDVNVDVITGPDQIIEMKYTNAGNQTIRTFQRGYYLPRGI
jgi:hypothetical protein